MFHHHHEERRAIRKMTTTTMYSSSSSSSTRTKKLRLPMMGSWPFLLLVASAFLHGGPPRIAHGWVTVAPSTTPPTRRTTTITTDSSSRRRVQQQPHHRRSYPLAANNNIDTDVNIVDEDVPTIEIEGAQFFGGNKEKEKFYDPQAEMNAAQEVGIDVSSEKLYDRFNDRQAFQDDTAATIAQDLQCQITSILYEKDESTSTTKTIQYAPSMQWETPFTVSSGDKKKIDNPFDALATAKEFYNRIDVAIIGGTKSLSNDNNAILEIQWEISLVWPTIWEPRVVLTGKSTLTLADNAIITKQVDALDVGNNNLMNCIVSQALIPRFWDVYHIAMTPSAEINPKLAVSGNKKKGLLSNYQLYELPPRLYLQPEMIDTGSRDDQNAAMVPNHAFGCVIKTMGPQKQRYVPTTPVQVQLLPKTKKSSTGTGGSGGGGIQLQWLIPLAVETIALNEQLPIPSPDDDDDDDNDNEEDSETEADVTTSSSSSSSCQYVYQPRRRVATMEYGGSPQDVEISDIRQRLYEQVVTNDGFKPKLDSQTQRPVFFFWQNNVKACYTNEGLGMAVYEWRPKFVQSNEIGIELEL